MNATQTKRIQKLTQAIQHTTLLDEVQKRMWIDQVLPKASDEQLGKMEDIFKQEHEAFKAETKKIQAKTDIVAQAIKHIKDSQRADKEAKADQAEAANMQALESELQNL